MPKNELDGLPVIDAPESENISVVVKPDDLQEGDEADPEQHDTVRRSGCHRSPTARYQPLCCGD